MVDFKKLASKKPAHAPVDPKRIFERLPKPAGVNDLWETQGRVLDLWQARRTEKDIVLKLNTGGGKTLVGMLICQALMNERHETALYLCANNQLVDQTLARAREFGFSAERYGKGALPTPFLNGDAILVGTYRSLFHGFSKFVVRGQGVPVKIGVVVCDDAHTAFADVRNAFSVVVTKKESPLLYTAITSRFRAVADEVGKLGSYDQRVGGQNIGVFEVPYWAWRSQAPEVRELLTKHAANSEYEYQLPLIIDHFDAATVLIRAEDIMITPLLPPVEMLPSFTEARHRVFMSATIADDSALVRTFGADPGAVRTPLAPASLAGVGERLILAPALTGVGVKDELQVTKGLCQSVASKGQGVVILVPSEARAKRWGRVGTVAVKHQVAEAVTQLTDRSSGDNGPYIFPNRYEGIDLAGDSCRMLVIDGLPHGASAYEEFRATVLQGSSQIELGLAQRVEQGMGRGTRGAGDYCVVILTGNVVDWISRRANAAIITEASRAQLEIGLAVSREILDADDLEAMVDKCLKRDREWVNFHARELAERMQSQNARASEHEKAIADAVVERDVVGRLLAKKYQLASEAAASAAGEHSSDRLYRGWLLQLQARAMCYMADGEGEEWRDVQDQAISANAMLLAPSSRRTTEPLPHVGAQAKNVVSVLESYETGAAYIAAVERVALQLTGAVTATAFEEAMRELGRLLGYDSERLDRGSGIGPDNVWRTGEGTVLVISCKSQKDPQSLLFKKDLQQLLIDAKWIEEHHPELERIPCIVMAGNVAKAGLPLRGIRLLQMERTLDVIGGLKRMAAELARADKDSAGLERLAARLLAREHLSWQKFGAKYLQEFVVKDE